MNLLCWYSQICLWVSFLHRPAWKDPAVQSRGRQLPTSLNQAAPDSDRLHPWWEEQSQREESPNLLKWNLGGKQRKRRFSVRSATSLIILKLVGQQTLKSTSTKSGRRQETAVIFTITNSAVNWYHYPRSWQEKISPLLWSQRTLHTCVPRYKNKNIK